MRNKGVEKKEYSKHDQRAPEQEKRNEGQRVRPEESQQLNDEPSGDQDAGPGNSPLDQGGWHGYLDSFQNVASFSVPTSCTISWQLLDMQESSPDAAFASMSGCLWCSEASS